MSDQSNTPTQQGITPDIKPMLDEAYNLGVDRCVTHILYSALEKDSFWNQEPQKSHLMSLSNQLQQLKKQ